MFRDGSCLSILYVRLRTTSYFIPYLGGQLLSPRGLFQFSIFSPFIVQSLEWTAHWLSNRNIEHTAEWDRLYKDKHVNVYLLHIYVVSKGRIIVCNSYICQFLQYAPRPSLALMIDASFPSLFFRWTGAEKPDILHSFLNCYSLQFISLDIRVGYSMRYFLVQINLREIINLRNCYTNELINIHKKNKKNCILSLLSLLSSTKTERESNLRV